MRQSRTAGRDTLKLGIQVNKNKGFSLIELMIVVVVIAILAAIAIPSYQQYIQKSRRADAKDAVTRLAAAQERYFFTNNGYANSPAALGFETTSSEKYYTLSISEGVTCNAGGNAYPCFTATATATGAQTADTKCQTFSITQSGRKTALDSAMQDNTDVCW